MIRRCLMLLCLFWLAGATAALADKRVALVIGNGDYRTLGRLANPVADADAIARLLTGGPLGFKVVRASDADHAAMLKAMAEFGNEATDADIALVYYAGHGMQVDQRNFLIPVGADIKSRVDLATQTVRLDDISDILSASGAKAKILLVDACRNNPLPASATRGASRGLARLDAASTGTLVAFATGPNAVADDGDNGHSPFAAALLKRLPEAGIEIRRMLALVRQDVHAATNQRQTPWVDEALLGDLYLSGTAISASPPIATQQPSPAPGSPVSDKADMAACTDLGTDPTPIKLEAYLDNFPKGYCAASVRRRLEALAKPAAGPAPISASPVSAPAQSDPPPYTVSSYWNHNGSRVALSASEGNRLFYYEAPRPGLAEVGVRKGALLFKGTASGGVYRGQAYVFSRECGPISYRVEGSAAGEPPTITLRGKAPRRARDCAQTGWRDDTLVFRYDSAAR